MGGCYAIYRLLTAPLLVCFSVLYLCTRVNHHHHKHSPPRGLRLPRRVPPFPGALSDHIQGHLAAHQREEVEDRPGRLPVHLCRRRCAHPHFNQGTLYGGY